MKKKLPGIFKKEVEATRANNKKVSYASSNTSNNIKKEVKNDYKSTLDGVAVEDKIRSLFKSSRYVFNIGVIIKTDRKDYDTKIAGKVKNSLVTINNEVIPIVEINDIIIKDRI